MRMMTFERLVASCLFVAAAGAVPVAAQASQIPETGWYVVRPGDTLETITRRHGQLGGEWRRNHQLNPNVRDPNLIYPGARLLLDLAEGLPGGAVVVGLDREVALQPTPLDWIPAQRTDILTGRSGLRTGQRGSAALVFGDGSTLGVSPDSVIFVADRAKLNRPGQTVEVIVGQTDVRATARRAAPQGDDDIEVVLGAARAQARPSQQGLEARARRESTGRAQVMLYVGEAAVEASQTRVDLGPGTGTTVPAGKAPSSPETLPLAPRFEPPALVLSQARIGWDPVVGAASYVVELCADPTCERIAERLVAQEPWWTPGFPPGTRVLARVAAVTPSGLDGFPSEPHPISVVASIDPPTVPPITAAGSLVWLGDVLVLGHDGTLELRDVPPEVTVEASIDGKLVADWGKGWSNGRHELELVATDAVGQQAISRQAFVSDLEPPLLTWQTGGERMLELHGLGDPRADRRKDDSGKPDRRVGIEWSTDGNNWWPTLIKDDQADRDGVLRTWTVYADTPQLFLRKKRRGAGFAAGAPVRIKDDILARIVAKDGDSAVRTLALSVVGGTAPQLRIEAIDVVGNRTAVEWPLDRDRL